MCRSVGGFLPMVLCEKKTILTPICEKKVQDNKQNIE